MKANIITICGSLGSGKSSTAKIVAQRLAYQHFSSGDFFRQVGVDLGLSVTELNIKAETSPEIDYLVDEKLRQLRYAGKIVIDSRTAYHWIPESFKVYLSLNPIVARDRILKSIQEDISRKKSEKEETVEQIYEKMQLRFESEQKRYWNLYKINNTDTKQFDLVIDTEKNNLSEVVEKVIEDYFVWQKKTV